MLPLKINTDRLTGIEVMSADNVLMAVDATVVWKIKNDPESLQLAASNAVMTQKNKKCAVPKMATTESATSSVPEGRL